MMQWKRSSILSPQQKFHKAKVRDQANEECKTSSTWPT